MEIDLVLTNGERRRLASADEVPAARQLTQLRERNGIYAGGWAAVVHEAGSSADYVNLDHVVEIRVHGDAEDEA